MAAARAVAMGRLVAPIVVAKAEVPVKTSSNLIFDRILLAIFKNV